MSESQMFVLLQSDISVHSAYAPLAYLNSLTVLVVSVANGSVSDLY